MRNPREQAVDEIMCHLCRGGGDAAPGTAVFAAAVAESLMSQGKPHTGFHLHQYTPTLLACFISPDYVAVCGPMCLQCRCCSVHKQTSCCQDVVQRTVLLGLKHLWQLAPVKHDKQQIVTLLAYPAFTAAALHKRQAASTMLR